MFFKKILTRTAMLMSLCLVTQALSSCGSDSTASGNDSDNSSDSSSESSSDSVINSDQLGEVQDGEEIAILTTNYGTIKMRFFPEYAPKAVENFVTHAKDGYYDGLTFHRVVEDFMIQGGDPAGDGTGGESIWGEGFEYETTPELHHINGAVAMAHSTLPDSNGSQFYIVQAGVSDNTTATVEAMKADPDGHLYVYQGQPIYTTSAIAEANGLSEFEYNGKAATVSELFPERFFDAYLEVGGVPSLDFGYTVFAQVFEGMDVVDAIAAVETTTNSSGEDSSPVEDVIIESIVITIYEG